MVFKYLQYIGIFTLLLSLPGVSTADSLAALVERTVMTNPDVLADEQERRARDEELIQARGGYGPTVEVNGGLGLEDSDNPVARARGDGDETLNRRESRIVVRQMVFDGFATKSEVVRQAERVNSIAYTVKSSAEQVALRTAEVYLDVLRRQELLDLAKQNLAAHVRTRDQIEMRSKSGLGRRADLDQVIARYAQAMANVIAEESNVADARTNYLRVTGELPEELIYPDTQSLQLPATLEEAVEAALAAHPTLKSAEADVQAANAQHKASRSEFYPRFDIEAGKGWSKNVDGQRGRSNDTIIMLRAQYRLFNMGKDQARWRQTAHLVDEAKEIRNNTRRQVIESIRLSWSQYQSGTEQLGYLKQHIVSAEATLKAYQKQFSIGKRSLLDVLDSENERFEAGRSYANTKYDRLFAHYRIQAGMGRLLPSLGVAPPEAAKVATVGRH